MSTPSTLPTRDTIDPQFKWDLTKLYADADAFRADIQEAKRELDQVVALRGKLGESATTLAEFFDLWWSLQRRFTSLRLYSFLPLSVDQDNQEARALAGELQGFAAVFMAETGFVQPELLALGSEKLTELCAGDERLADYEAYIAQLERRRPYVRSAEVEGLLGSLTDVFGTSERAYNSFVDGEMPFADVSDSSGNSYTVGRSSYSQLISSPDRELRKNAWHSYTDSFQKYENTITDLYLGRVKQSAFLTKTRGYASSVEEQLIPREVPLAVLDNVINTFKANLPVWHRYWAARKKVLGVETLEEYDVFAPLMKEPVHVPYEQAVEWLLDGLAPLGDEYQAELERGLKRDQWVDVYPNRGKRDGAFATGLYRGPSFIMMSYHDDLGSLSTLAHELGHAVHSALMNKTQPLRYANYSMVEAETASNFNQALMRPYLFDKLTGTNERLAILDETFGNFHRYFFIMPTLVRFEMAVHDAILRGEGMPSTRLNQIMRDLFQEGYGDEISADERTGTTWAHFGHLYMPFYTFQYAGGIAAAAALADEISNGVDGSLARYLNFLKGGRTVQPVEAFRRAGIDLTSPEPIEKAFSVLEGHVAQLEQLANEQ